jgi:hypothetical protein
MSAEGRSRRLRRWRHSTRQRSFHEGERRFYGVKAVRFFCKHTYWTFLTGVMACDGKQENKITYVICARCPRASRATRRWERRVKIARRHSRSEMCLRGRTTAQRRELEPIGTLQKRNLQAMGRECVLRVRETSSQLIALLHCCVTGGHTYVTR